METVNSWSIRLRGFDTPEFTDLSKVLALTQSQVDTMEGDTGTILPEGLNHPAHWPDLRQEDANDTVSTPTSPEAAPEIKTVLSTITAPFDVEWTDEGLLHASQLIAINPAPRKSLPAVSPSLQIEQLSALGQLAAQIKTSIRRNEEGNKNSIIGDISAMFEAIEQEVHKPEGTVLIVAVRANVHALKRLEVHSEALSAVDEALFKSFMEEAANLPDLFPILREVEDPHYGDLVPVEILPEALEATEHMIKVLTADRTVELIGPSVPGVTRDLAAYPWDSDRKRVSAFAAFGTRIKEALETRPPWVDGAAAYTTLLMAIIALLRLF